MASNAADRSLDGGIGSLSAASMASTARDRRGTTGVDPLERRRRTADRIEAPQRSHERAPATNDYRIRRLLAAACATSASTSSARTSTHCPPAGYTATAQPSRGQCPRHPVRVTHSDAVSPCALTTLRAAANTAIPCAPQALVRGSSGPRAFAQTKICAFGRSRADFTTAHYLEFSLRRRASHLLARSRAKRITLVDPFEERPRTLDHRR